MLTIRRVGRGGTIWNRRPTVCRDGSWGGIQGRRVGIVDIVRYISIVGETSMRRRPTPSRGGEHAI